VALGVVLAVALVSALASAQQPVVQQPPAPAPAQAPSMAGKTAEQVYLNIQVLQGTPAEDLNQLMHLMRADLGVDCEYCHVSTTVGAGAEKDDLEPKQTARKMMKMVMDINKTQFGGAQLVTCYTCHRGSTVPITTPILPITFEPEKPAPDLPTVDRIFSKYIQALGGEQAIRRVTSRVITGTQDVPAGPGGRDMAPARTEQYRKAPNQSLNVFHGAYQGGSFTTANGFDGATAWTQSLTGQVAAALKLDQDRARRDADFYDSLHLKQKYGELTVDGIEKVNNRPAYVVTGVPADDNPEELYFDVQTGFLLRKTTIVPTAIGDSPFEINYDDYRDTGSGVKIPFLVRMDPPNPRNVLHTQSTLRVLKVQDNVAIESSKFVKPQSRPAPPPAPAAAAR